MNENNAANLSQAIEKDIFSSISRVCQSFFKKFLWRIIYTLKFKEFELMTPEEINNILISEIQKPKMKEISLIHKKRFIEDIGDRDIHVNKIFLSLSY